jgi:chromosome segregation ATPase
VETVHSTEEGVALAIDLANVQETDDPVLGTDEVRPTDGVEPIMETVDIPAPLVDNPTPEEDIAQINMDTKQDTIPLRPPSSSVSMAATAVAARPRPAEITVREQANKIMLMLETAMEKVYEWSERVEAQISGSAGRDVTVWKKGLVNCEESLKQKTASLTEAEKGQAELRQALEAKDTELAAVRSELEAERRKRTNADQLREELQTAQADVKSLRRRNGVLRGDVDEARQNEKRMFDTFEVMNVELEKNKERWKQIQTRPVTEVERTNEENARLKQAMTSPNAATEKLKQERDEAVRGHQQAQEELGPLRLELSVAVEDLKKARVNHDRQ